MIAGIYFGRLYNFSIKFSEVCRFQELRLRMESSAEDNLLKEAGFRVEREGEKVFFVTPRPCTRRLYNKCRANVWLDTEHVAGRHLNIKVEMFSFLKRKRNSAGDQSSGMVGNTEAAGGRDTAVGAGGGDSVNTAAVNTDSRVSVMVKQLCKDPAVPLDHKKIISNSAALVDSWLNEPMPTKTQDKFEQFRARLAATQNMESLLAVLYGDLEFNQLLCHEFSNIIIAEIGDVDTKHSPLSNFPANVNTNFFCEIVNFGMKRCPRTMSLLANVAIRSRKSVMPKDILVVANAFANICYIGNNHLDSLITMRSLMLQAGGTSDSALDIRVSLIHLFQELHLHLVQIIIRPMVKMGAQLNHGFKIFFYY